LKIEEIEIKKHKTWPEPGPKEKTTYAKKNKDVAESVATTPYFSQFRYV
jgi:hypothetical protein